MPTLDHCAICRSASLPTVFDLGNLHPSCFPLPGEPLPPKVPLRLVRCDSCGLVQLGDTIDPATMHDQYWYQSGLNPSMVRDLKDVVDGAMARVKTPVSPFVIDIGCNDGSLLSCYPPGVWRIGYDPAKNLAEKAKWHCDWFHNRCFGEYEGPPADIITAVAMFYGLPDPHPFLRDVAEALSSDGIFVVQMTDLVSMLRANAFDNICHEHRQYYSLEVLCRLLAEHGLSVFDCEYNGVNGGSLRVYVCHAGATAVLQKVGEQIARERLFLKSGTCQWAAFKKRINQVGMAVKSEFRWRDNPIALGASTKGNTLLQYWGIGPDKLHRAAEVNPDKIGRTTATGIPIISEAEAIAMNPDVMLVLPWHFKAELTRKMQPYLADGGALLFPLPEPALVTKKGAFAL